tara:strand:+ start:927 stop:1133 length:207 start_codon:yes stop_codon:yes gene_type:complete
MVSWSKKQRRKLMKELFIKFDFNVRVEIDEELEEDSIDYYENIQDQIIGWWVDITELPDYEILEKEEV